MPDPFSDAKTVPTRPIPESYWVIPGRFLAGEYPGASFAIETTRKRLDAFLKAGFNSIINLTMEREVEEYANLMEEQASTYGMSVECLRFEIGDYGLPTQKSMLEILDAIDDALARDRKVYVHCHGGIGRTGTTVGCYLVRHGHTGQQALQKVANWWQKVPKSSQYPNSPETFRQEEFVMNWPEQTK